jgi:5-methylcytosine-specific restriction protein A
MADRALRPCKYAGCGELTRDISSYCDTHKSSSDNRRESSSKRGYDYRWQQFRESYLRKHPLCIDCLNLKEKKYTEATEVHHKEKLKVNKEKKFEEENLMPLCEKHHKERTARGE